MIYIFHGDNQLNSRIAINQFLETNKNFDILRLDIKDIDLDRINGFINSQSLFSSSKIIVFFNFFSIPKATLDKILKILGSNRTVDVVIWQDKKLTPPQLKNFPQSKVEVFPLDKKMFACLNNIYPKSLLKFLPLYHQVLKQEPFELFLFWVKLTLRKQLTSFSRFPPEAIRNAYLQTIELDYQSKTGQLNVPKELALERIFINLLR